MKAALLRLLGWAAVALLVTAPVALAPGASLIGDPDIDVWNHAWGYWWVARAIGGGALPFHTDLVGGPGGGTLWFIDTPGAIFALPLTWAFGPAVAYNGTLIARIAWAGFGAEQLARALDDDPWAGRVAGLAYMTAPFLLCELANGISEVCATGWLPLTLWAAWRALRDGRMASWARLGLLQGLTSVVTFYYGLTSALLVTALVVGIVAMRWRAGERPGPRLLGGLALAAGVGALLVVPHWLAFRESLSAPDALIRRSADLNLALMAHNAVDPRIYVVPGGFQSVDLAAVYGEPFVHTGYLRWAVLGLAGVAIATARSARGWAGLAALSLLLGLGPYLWWGGEWATVGGRLISLPFGWLRAALPQLAITHPLRLSLGAQAVACALAGVGAVRLARGRTGLVVALAALCALEGLFGGAAAWPIPRAPASVPGVFAEDGGGMVLELPAEVGTTMATSRYFWHQTAHGRPIPWTPDARLGSARDPETLHGLVQPMDPRRPGPERPRTPDARTVARLREVYGLVVVHTDLEAEAGLGSSYVDALTPALGLPERDGPRAIWRLR